MIILRAISTVAYATVGWKDDDGCHDLRGYLRGIRRAWNTSWGENT